MCIRDRQHLHQNKHTHTHTHIKGRLYLQFSFYISISPFVLFDPQDSSQIIHSHSLCPTFLTLNSTIVSHNQSQSMVLNIFGFISIETAFLLMKLYSWRNTPVSFFCPCCRFIKPAILAHLLQLPSINTLTCPIMVLSVYIFITSFF